MNLTGDPVVAAKEFYRKRQATGWEANGKPISDWQRYVEAAIKNSGDEFKRKSRKKIIEFSCCECCSKPYSNKGYSGIPVCECVLLLTENPAHYVKLANEFKTGIKLPTDVFRDILKGHVVMSEEDHSNISFYNQNVKTVAVFVDVYNKTPEQIWSMIENYVAEHWHEGGMRMQTKLDAVRKLMQRHKSARVA
jgi:hypothetical protein